MCERRIVKCLLRIYFSVLVTQQCLTLCDSMDHSLPGYSVLGILQARILEWVAIPSSRGSSHSRDLTQDSCTAGRFFTSWATWEAQDITVTSTEKLTQITVSGHGSHTLLHVRTTRMLLKILMSGPTLKPLNQNLCYWTLASVLLKAPLIMLKCQQAWEPLV